VGFKNLANHLFTYSDVIYAHRVVVEEGG
jgi:hypothetical protein